MKSLFVLNVCYSHNLQLLLYEALLLEESGQYDQAVSRLEACPR